MSSSQFFVKPLVHLLVFILFANSDRCFIWHHVAYYLLWTFLRTVCLTIWSRGLWGFRMSLEFIHRFCHFFVHFFPLTIPRSLQILICCCTAHVSCGNFGMIHAPVWLWELEKLVITNEFVRLFADSPTERLGILCLLFPSFFLLLEIIYEVIGINLIKLLNNCFFLPCAETIQLINLFTIQSLVRSVFITKVKKPETSFLSTYSAYWSICVVFKMIESLRRLMRESLMIHC